MARNFAVVVGINNYKKIQPLKYAKSDAEKMRDFFMQDLQVSPENLYFFSDDSPCDVWGRDTQPTYSNLETFFTESFETPFLESGDTLWFYFSGHGMPYEGRDCLLPIDFSLSIASKTTIPLSSITDRLRRSGADNVVMLIDACRSDGAKNAGMGIGEEKQQGVITFFSCSPSQVSYEIDEIGQGAFTNVLLEALRIQGEGNCATVERFYQYLRTQVPRLTQRYKNYVQIPYAAIEPATKLHYILLPKFANLTDITSLKNDALYAEVKGDLTLAKQLWKRINVASSGNDQDFIDAIERLANKQSTPSPQPRETASFSGSRTPSAPTVSPPTVPKEFQREVIGRKTQPAPPASEVKKNPVKLVSAKGIDYRELENWLKSKQWYEADQLTSRLMLRVKNREKEKWLTLENIKNFPCEDLQTIDNLWLHYSNGLYGFSVQKQIYVECCANAKDFRYPNSEAWDKFCYRTAWKKDGEYVNYPKPFFEINFMHEKGHLPIGVGWEYREAWGFWEALSWGGNLGKHGGKSRFSFLASRLVKCNR